MDVKAIDGEGSSKEIRIKIAGRYFPHFVRSVSVSLSLLSLLSVGSHSDIEKNPYQIKDKIEKIKKRGGGGVERAFGKVLFVILKEFGRCLQVYSMYEYRRGKFEKYLFF